MVGALVAANSKANVWPSNVTPSLGEAAGCSIQIVRVKFPRGAMRLWPPLIGTALFRPPNMLGVQWLSCLFFPFLYLLLFFYFFNRLASVVRMRSDRYYVWCQYLRVFSWVASCIIGFSRREQWDVCTSMDLAHRRLTQNFTLYMFLVEAWVASAVIYACTTLGFCFFPWCIPQLQRDWSLSCDHGLDCAS